MLNRLSKIRNQRGITSIVVVFVLVTLLMLIGIGFTKIMNRSLQSSAASQQATAANYAAQSGVNDVLSYLKTQPATAATKCDDLIKTGAPLANAAKLSSDGSTAYTCVLVDPSPTSLFYQGLSPQKSQIVKITTSAQLASLLFSWQSPNRQQNQFVPAANGQTLYDEKTWSDKNYAPLLQLTLYPVPASGDLSNAQASSKTFFLYPQTGGSNTLAYAAAGDTTSVNCSSKNIGNFVGSADYDCNLVINSLPSASYFYARFAPYYDQAVVKIKGNDGTSQPVQFKNVQSVVDVTAKSGGATKRLQARVDTSSAGGSTDFNISAGSDNAPEFALGSADTICKRLIVPPSTSNPVTIDAGSVANCQLSLVPPPPPDVTTGSASNITTSSAMLNGTVNPNGYNVTNCHFDYGTTQNYGSPGSPANCSSLPGAGKAAVGVSANISGLSAAMIYHFRLVATNANGTTNGNDVTFPTHTPPPPPPPSAQLTYLGVSVASNYTSNDYKYSCSNSTRATISLFPNMHNGTYGGENSVPGTSGTVTLGGYYWPGDLFSATLKCYSADGRVGNQSIPNTYFSPTIFSDFNFSSPSVMYQATPSTSTFCGSNDQVHHYVICIGHWWAHQGFIDSYTDAYISVKNCNIHWAGNDGGIYNATLPSTNGNNYSLGFNSPPSGSVTITCYGDQGIPASGPPSNAVTHSILVAALLPGVRPAFPPAPAPAPAPAPFTPLPPIFAPPPPGGCGLLPGGGFYNYGLMFPNIFFGRIPACF